MFSSTMLSTVTLALLSTLASATPMQARACHDCLGPAGPASLVNPIINVEVFTNNGLDTVKVSHMVPTSINIPTPCIADGSERCLTSEVRIATTGNNTNADAVECRLFSDLHATIGSAPFNTTQSFFVSTNTDYVGSWLCYISGWNQ